MSASQTKDLNKVDITNWQCVGVQGFRDRYIVVSNPMPKMTRIKALVHAAWIVAIAEETPGEFEEILKKIKNT